MRKGHPFKKVNRLWSEHLIRTENELEIHCALGIGGLNGVDYGHVQVGGNASLSGNLGE